VCGYPTDDGEKDWMIMFSRNDIIPPCDGQT